MNLIDGIATRVRSSVDLGDADEHDHGDELQPRLRSPKYIVRFELTAREVTVTSRSPVSIGEGDRVLVAGWYRSGVLDALAYRNESTLAEGDRGWWPALALSIILIVVGLAMLAMSIDATPAEPVALGLAALLVATSLYIGYGASKVLEARNLLRRQARSE